MGQMGLGIFCCLKLSHNAPKYVILSVLNLLLMLYEQFQLEKSPKIEK